MRQNPRLQASFIFPIRWINDPEDRKYLSDNFLKALKKADVRSIYATSSTDRYAADFGGGFVSAYFIRLKTHAYQPVKVKITEKQMEQALKPAFPHAKLLGLKTRFVQTNSQTSLPVVEMEIYY